ncbi:MULTISPECIES: hypothetical protein [Methylobacterium]|uniref:Uncharacterized protein n=1 Tax=Methylobacterium thuringiense TaxID=1003091 RepID=A0ABQ4TRJ4_9HYPH|nr:MULTISPECIES: hypothetical protein [Methylobacterium]TXN24195.1 hypothetical protein FV217_04380 [Methylobacterium sp. WL9]GJE56255.1 hypothetical protein EKPJFOCH_2756 [Methylobacterium thuringiense]
MLDLTESDERAVERLSFFMLKEAYGAIASVLVTLDPEVAQTLFERIERQIEETLQRIHSQQSEGTASTGVATAIAETLVPVLEECHGHETKPSLRQPAGSPAGGEASKVQLHKIMAPQPQLTAKIVAT